jgi:hypothetical protein
MVTQELSVWGPGGDYVFVGIDLVGPALWRGGVIGGQPGGIGVRRLSWKPEGPCVELVLRLDIGDVGLVLSPESATALAKALVAAAQDPGDN